MGGSLDITTSESSLHTVTVEIDGELDQATDPEEVMLGVLQLGGELNVSGNSVPVKMAPLSQTAVAGSSTLDIVLASSFQVGGELILPDTQE